MHSSTSTLEKPRPGQGQYRCSAVSRIGRLIVKEISTHQYRIATLAVVLMMFANALLAADDIVPRIELSNVPLIDAIKNLARQSGINYIVDPHLAGSEFGPGRLVRSPAITVRWTNMTSQAALSMLLEAHQLVMVTNPATTITRIAPANLRVKPVEANQVGTNSSNTIPLLVVDSMPLTEAINRVAQAAGLTVSLDSEASAPAIDPQGTVTFCWERVSGRQALAALLDNYGLAMTEDAASATGRITLKPKAK